MGELTASLAHQLNQPLAGILNNAEAAAMLIDDGRAPLAELREIVAEIMDDDHRAGEVIRRMREMLTRVERPPAQLDVNAVVRDVASLIASDTIIRNVSIAFECDAGPLSIVGNKIDLQEALLNVLMNAMDAVNGRVVPDRQIVVRTSREDGRVQIVVRDRGAGLVAGTEQRIFEPFFSTKESGMGMGLAVARSLLGHHHGTIAAANHPDGGAVVTIDLPAAHGA
jgi:C4-dicarboxylate-specific signal transduction histidine kinase